MKLDEDTVDLHRIYGFRKRERRVRLREYFCKQLPNEDSYPKIAIQAQIEKVFFHILNYLREYQTKQSELIEELTAVCLDISTQYSISNDEMSSGLLLRALEYSTESLQTVSEQRRKKGDTRDLILKVALNTFSEMGYHSTTMDSIARKARLGKGTLYRYFSNKEKLFSELIRFHLEQLEAQINAVFSEQDDVLTIIAKYLRAYLRFFDRNKDFYKILLYQRRDIGGKAKELYIKKVLRRVPALKRKIYEATKRGVLKDIDFFTVFYGVIGFVDGVMQKWLAKECSYPLVDELPTVLETLFYGFVESKDYDKSSTKETIEAKVAQIS